MTGTPRRASRKTGRGSTGRRRRPDGTLGGWRPYTLADLVPGTWTLTVLPPDGKAISQVLTVTAGGTVKAADIFLACTGDVTPATKIPAVWPFALFGPVPDRRKASP